MRKQGLSLVEILIASSLLIATMVPLWGLMGSSHQQVIRSVEEVKASQLAAEIMEQLENSCNPACLPETDEEVEYNLNSGGVVTIGKEPSAVVVKISHFDEYLMPKLIVTSSDELCGSVGRIVGLTIAYKSKEGRDLDYTLRGFISVNR